MVSLKASLSRCWSVLIRPEQSFKNLPTLEHIVATYLTTLLALGIFSGIINILWSLGKSVYLDLFLNVEIQYLRLLNYVLGQGVSVLFFTIFAGTFLIFIISIIINLFTHMKLAQLYRILLTAISPLLILAWIPGSYVGLVAWSIILFIIGNKTVRNEKIRKDSIAQRD